MGCQATVQVRRSAIWSNSTTYQVLPLTGTLDGNGINEVTIDLDIRGPLVTSMKVQRVVQVSEDGAVWTTTGTGGDIDVEGWSYGVRTSLADARYYRFGVQVYSGGSTLRTAWIEARITTRLV